MSERMNELLYECQEASPSPLRSPHELAEIQMTDNVKKSKSGGEKVQ